MTGTLRGCFGIPAGKRNDARVAGRLGKRDLGRYAYENRMPEWLSRMLEDEEKQHLKDAPLAIPDILLKVLEQDLNIETAYLCHSAVRYIGKVKTSGKSEGNNFCGYHNIQMLWCANRAGDTRHDRGCLGSGFQ